MAKFCPLFSGSSGNSTYIGTHDGGILVDAGVSASRIKQSLSDLEIELESVKAIFVTHSHTDHISGIKTLASRNNIPVYLTQGTFDGIKNANAFSDKIEYHVIDDGEVTNLDFAKISHFNTSHDCVGSCGYVVDLGSRKIAVCTDLGFISDEVHDAIAGCDLVLLESNHDIQMLQTNTFYPYPLKKRILSDEGHLSNNACADEAARLLECGTTRFVLAHLSRENNMPPLAKETTKARLTQNGAKEDSDYRLMVAAPFNNRAILL